MKIIAAALGIIVFSIGILIGVYGFRTGRFTVVNPPTSTGTPTPSPFAQLTGTPGKAPTACSAFADGEFASEFKLNEAGKLPELFPTPPGESWLCGYVPSRQSVYYISSLEDKILLDYYRTKLEQKKCSSTGVQPAPPDRSYAYALPFTCEQGSGVIATLATMSAYIVNYYDR